MKGIALSTLAVLLGLEACRDQPTAPATPAASDPLRAAIHDVGIPVPVLSYNFHEGDLWVRWRWGDDQDWDLVSFELRLEGKRIEGEWSIKPYAQDELGLYPTQMFTWTRSDWDEKVPELCLSVMAKSGADKGAPTTTYHAENCDPVLEQLSGSSPVMLRRKTISAGAYHTCALGLSGEAHCWGQYYGTPVPIRGGRTFTQISAGEAHTCALTPSGAAYCWGESYHGQLGGGSAYRAGVYLDPVPVLGGFAFMQIAAGGEHTCALTPAGAAWCWGRNYSGELGIGTNWAYDVRDAPVAVAGGLVFTQITAGRSHTCGLTSGGKAYCWGSSSDGQLGDETFSPKLAPTAVVGGLAFAQISAGTTHTCALTAEGEAFCWGWNLYGQVGDGTVTSRGAPTLVQGGHIFAQITTGLDQTCALTPSGSAYCWGLSWQHTPAPVSGGLTWTQITGGGHVTEAHACGVAMSGQAYCWGNNDTGQLGDGTTTRRSTPTAVSAKLATAQFDAGNRHTCAVTPGGTAHCWGWNEFGQLGDGSTDPRSTPMPVQTGSWSPPVVFTQVSAGFDHTCGLTAVGQAYCWGRNDFGQLGNGTTGDENVPRPIAGSYVFSQINTGYSHTCAITTTGTAYCWGSNEQGQLGDGTVTPRSTPTAVAGGLAFAQISTGSIHTCASTSAGLAYCWGYNYDGQLGDLTRIRRLTPTAVSGGLAFAQITTGLHHSCGVSMSGAAYCWGNNTFGALGDGTVTDRNTPTVVAGGLTFAQITGGGAHTCARTGTGAAYCWGRNQIGQLGDGTQMEHHIPTAVAGGLSFTHLSAGTDHTCGRIGITAYWIFPAGFCWGSNGGGQLGADVTMSYSLTPRAILTLFRG